MKENGHGEDVAAEAGASFETLRRFIQAMEGGANLPPQVETIEDFVTEIQAKAGPDDWRFITTVQAGRPLRARFADDGAIVLVPGPALTTNARTIPGAEHYAVVGVIDGYAGRGLSVSLDAAGLRALISAARAAIAALGETG